jgi:FdhE protein
MPRTASGLRTDDRLSPAAIDPAWQAWIALVELAVAESRQPAWRDTVRGLGDRSPDAPFLHGATLHVNANRAAKFTCLLAEKLGIVTTHVADSQALIRAGIERDPVALETLAGALAVSADTVAVYAQLSATPLLLNIPGTLSVEALRDWQRGYCPVCGTWPAMVEMRGIQRERRLRCGCCGGEWSLPVLRCAFCDEIDHRKLGSLLNEGEQTIRVETCGSCQGYLKAITTLGVLPFATLAERDVSSIAFDLVARDRGYRRPTRAGWQVRVNILQ